MSDSIQIERLVAKGGMGAVYRGTRAGESIAVKVPLKRFRDDHTVRQQFVQEAQALARVPHPNIVRLVCAGDSAVGPFVATEWLEGESLVELIANETPLPLLSIYNLFSQLLSAVEFSHSRGVVHADIKPENIMILRRAPYRERLVLFDFGVSSVDDRRPGEDLYVYGTPFYLAPEALHGGSGTVVAEIYALGTLLWEMVSGLGAALVTEREIAGDSNRRVASATAGPVGLNEAA